MSIVVQKYGGTSVADIHRIRSVASRVLKSQKAGHNVVVVVSAMAGETNRLVELAREINLSPPERELDVLVSTGEQVSAALLTLAIRDKGGKAESLMGHQVRIITDSTYAKARIKGIEKDRLLKSLEVGHIAVVAGFQGIDEEGNITTLGRGGSDTTAVALAAVLEAFRCEIYTDVEGVYTADPNIVPEARKLKHISFDEMMEMAGQGAKVMQVRSVEIAKKFNVPFVVRSSFSNEPGTLVDKEGLRMEGAVVSAVTCDANQARIAIYHVQDRPGVAARIFGPLAQANIVVDMIIQNVSAEGLADITFTVPRNDLEAAFGIVEKVSHECGATKVEKSDNIAKVSIIGVGMQYSPGIAAKMFEALSKSGINISMISTSEIKISCAVERKFAELAVRVLHERFGLEKEETG
ncbi:MAG: aspartate kinase [Deltaproteobacteria bacterium]|nr:aspartate kinase [Deltaproteobacteria bacterium]